MFEIQFINKDKRKSESWCLLEVTGSQAFYTFYNSFYLMLFLLVISVCGIIKIAELNNSLTDNMGIYW